MYKHTLTSYIQYRKEQGLQLERCTCVAIRKGIPDQLHLGQEYLLDRNSIKNDSGQDIYVDVYNDSEEFIGRLLTMHFNIDTTDVSVKSPRTSVQQTSSTSPIASTAQSTASTSDDENPVDLSHMDNYEFPDKPKVRRLF